MATYLHGDNRVQVQDMFPPFELVNCEFFPFKFLVGPDIEICKSRLNRAVDLLSQGIGLKCRVVIESGEMNIDEIHRMWKQLDPWEDLQLGAVIKYKPSKENPGRWVLEGFLNHVFFDRRVIQAVFDVNIPLERLNATSPSKIVSLKEQYGSKMFFGRILGMRQWALNALDFEETSQGLVRDLNIFEVEKDHVYDVFYDTVGKGLSGNYLLFIVKDTYHTDFKKTGAFFVHSLYGYFVRAVTLPCSREKFRAQIQDGSTPYHELFKRHYKGVWTVNDHSTFLTETDSLNVDYQEELSLVDQIRYSSLLFSKGWGAGSIFMLFNIKQGQTDTRTALVWKCHKPNNWLRKGSLALGALAAGAMIYTRIKQ